MSGRNVSNPHVQTFKVIGRFFGEHKCAPTIEEIAELTGVTTSTINRHLLILEAEGLIRRPHYATSGIELTGLKVTEVNAHAVNYPSRKYTRQPLGAYSLNFPPMHKMTKAELEKRIERVVRKALCNPQVVPGEDAVRISAGPLFKNERLRAIKIG